MDRKTATQAEHLQSFTKNFVLERMSIILKNNYFYSNNSFIDQIKGTAVGTHTAVAYANLTCGYLEVMLFNKLPEIFSDDTKEFFLKNYFGFLYDMKNKCK